MAQKFKETAHLHTDMNKYGENYDRIFGKKTVSEASTDIVGESDNREREESKRIKELAKSEYFNLGSSQDTEGFPEASSFIYGFTKGYQAAKEGK